MKPEDRVGQLIRSNHRYSFRSGQWGRIDGIVEYNGRVCYRVMWNEGYFSDDALRVDHWAVDATDWLYEFAQVLR